MLKQITIFIATAMSLSAAPLPDSSPSLSSDAMLARTVTVDETGISVSDLLKEIEGNQLILTADRACQDQKLQLHLIKRPLHEVMTSLAQLLPGQWVKKTGSEEYQLGMDPTAVARRTKWWYLYLAERQKALAAQRQLILQQMKIPAESTINNPREPISPRDLAAEKANASFYSSLAPSLQEEIAGQMNEIPFYAYQPAIGSSDIELNTVVPVRDLPSAAQASILQAANKSLAKMQEMRDLTLRDFPGRTLPPVPYDGKTDETAMKDAIVGFANGGISLDAIVFMPDGTPMGSAFSLSPDYSPAASTLPLEQDALPDVVKKLGKKAPAYWITLAQYQQKRVWPNDPPIPGHRPPDPHPPFPKTRRVDWLHWVADQSKIEYISDYYSVPASPMTNSQNAAPLKVPLKDELDYEAADQDISWQKQDSQIYLFRDNRWYRDDFLEVPNRLIGQWESEKAATYSVPPEKLPALITKLSQEDTITQMQKQLERDNSISSQLSLFQITRGLVWYVEEPKAETAIIKSASPGLTTTSSPQKIQVQYPFSWIAERLSWETNTTAFYKSLEPSMQDELLQGVLPFDLLSVEQQQQVIALVPALGAVLLAENDSDAQNTEQDTIVLGLTFDMNVVHYIPTRGVGSLDDFPVLRLKAMKASPPESVPSQN